MFQKGQLPGGMACARKDYTPMPQYLSWDSNVIDCGGGQNIWKIYFEDAGAALPVLNCTCHAYRYLYLIASSLDSVNPTFDTCFP
jgi:hypothetical protein